jgi:hypothetical protein
MKQLHFDMWDYWYEACVSSPPEFLDILQDNRIRTAILFYVMDVKFFI